MQKLLGIKESFIMWKEFNSHRIFFIHKHGRRFIVSYTNMAVVMSCENDLLNRSNIWPPKRAEKASSTQPVCGKFPETWTLFQTKISDLPYPICRNVPLLSRDEWLNSVQFGPCPYPISKFKTRRLGSKVQPRRPFSTIIDRKDIPFTY